MRLDPIPKASSKDEGTQAYLYTKQPGNLNNVEQITNNKLLQHPPLHLAWTWVKFSHCNPLLDSDTMLNGLGYI